MPVGTLVQGSVLRHLDLSGHSCKGEALTRAKQSCEYLLQGPQLC